MKRDAEGTSLPTIRGHLLYILLNGALLLALFAFLRLALLLYNQDQIGSTSVATLLHSFFTGMRFDMRLVVIGCLPLLLALVSYRAMAARPVYRVWLTLYASLNLFLGLVELDFYREFHQRLNSLVFQYIEQDAATVLSMLWHGFPVLRYLILWALLSWLLFKLFQRAECWADAWSRVIRPKPRHLLLRWAVLVPCLLVSVVAARGTLRQGPPLRWGDAFQSESAFANQLALNGTLTLASAAKQHWSKSGNNAWKATLPAAEAQRLVRKMLLTPHDRLVDGDSAAVRRITEPSAEHALPIRNVVVILMESFSGHYVGALGSDAGITPNFDRLAKEGLLFTRFFSNGTHTHQGMFATMACFPNLPGFEYLMQQPQGGYHFSGLPQLLSVRGFNDLYVYNGDFAWDNQYGFFRNQGMNHFIGRHDYLNPVFSDPTWGVSDQDMFDRAAKELKQEAGDKPFYALLQTLSNHTPYALPVELPVEHVTGYGPLDEHLTAMRYSDWALGRFFEQVRDAPFYRDTLFVIVGDHGFGSREQLTSMDLYRYHVPLLLIGPGVREHFGDRDAVTGTQIDIVPTIMGRLGMTVQHQCWGRDLLELPAGDEGFGVIKPSGGSQTVALLSGDRILVKAKGVENRIYRYHLGAEPGAERLKQVPDEAQLEARLEAFLQTATGSLVTDTAGVGEVH